MSTNIPKSAFYHLKNKVRAFLSQADVETYTWDYCIALLTTLVYLIKTAASAAARILTKKEQI